METLVAGFHAALPRRQWVRPRCDDTSRRQELGRGLPRSKSPTGANRAVFRALATDRLADCDESDLYYGFGKASDYAGALECGWFQRAHPQSKVGNMFYGPGVLTMLYANGKGVPRNLDLAIRFACENSWASEAEMAYRIGHLESLRDSPARADTFDLCDDITSGLSDGICTSIQTQRADGIRNERIAAVVKTLPNTAKRLFASLQAAESAFEDARVQNEVDLSGTSRAAFQLEEEAILRDQFLINLQRFGRGDIPSASAADLDALDQRLNDVYREIESSPAKKWEYGTVNPEGIQKTERAWAALVNAWIAFGREAYPNLPATRIRAQLIRLRLHQLRSLARS